MFTISNFVSMYSYYLPLNGQVTKLCGPINFTGAMLTRLSVGNGLMGRFDMAGMRNVYWDAKTGAKSYDTEPMTQPWGCVTVNDFFVNGKLYIDDYDGVHCYDANTGKELWYFSSGNAGMQTPYGTWLSKLGGFKMVGDLLYYQTGIWHNTEVYARGDRTYCLNATTGQQLWNFSGYSDLRGVANGYAQVFNQYDQCLYTFSKGPSATTVSAPQTAVPIGSTVLIQGTVIDQSPGKANGYAAISDEWMTPWMEYIYQQQPKPANAMGVPVSIDAYDPNGNLVHLGDTTSDASGVYSLAVAPSALSAGAGQYRIIATFKGSNGYYMSSAETSLVMDAAAAPAATATPVSFDAINNSTLTYTLGAAIAIIIAIAIVGLLLLRKRP